MKKWVFAVYCAACGMNIGAAVGLINAGDSALRITASFLLSVSMACLAYSEWSKR